jgi:hypothetical protein
MISHECRLQSKVEEHTGWNLLDNDSIYADASSSKCKVHFWNDISIPDSQLLKDAMFTIKAHHALRVIQELHVMNEICVFGTAWWWVI